MPQQYPPPPTEVIVTRPPRLKERTDSEEAKRKEREARSIAIEKAYVHDVYEQISQHVAGNNCEYLKDNLK